MASAKPNESFHVKRAGYCGCFDIQAEPMPRGTQYPQDLHERAFRMVAEIGEAEPEPSEMWPMQDASRSQTANPGVLH